MTGSNFSFLQCLSLVGLMLAGCANAAASPTATSTSRPPTSTITVAPPTASATATNTARQVPPTATPTDTATDTPIPPTATLTNTPLRQPTTTSAPVTPAAQPTVASPTPAPPPAGAGPTITGISLVNREPQAITISVSFSGLQPNQKYNTIAYSVDCPNGCGRFGIIHSGLFNYFTPASADWSIQLKVGIDSVFCQGGNSTASNTLTIDLAVGVSLNADYSATFPLANTWCV